MSSLSVASRSLRLIALAALAAALTACGGGGSGDDGGGGDPPATGSLQVTVTDTFGAPIEDAQVEATVGSSTRNGQTAADGVAVLSNVNVGSASVAVSRVTFVPQTVSAQITENATTELAVELVRETSTAGGSLTSRGSLPVVSGNFQTMTFEIELVIVNSSSEAITTLTAADFQLIPCDTDPVSPTFDCVRVAPDSDVGYEPTTPTAQDAQLVPGQTAEPYAAGLMIDQSQSINGTDPTGARLFSAKAFLEGLSPNDWVLLSAFADQGGNTAAQIPDQPLTVYPPFRQAGTVSDPPSYFDTLDSLGDLVGGGTPLYESLDLLRQQVVADATLPAGIARAVVIFTDGEDDNCGAPGSTACRTRRGQSITAAQADDLRVFTIGLSTEIDFEALAELANQTGGAFLFAETADQLIPLYGTVGELLSLSLPTYRLRFTVNADSANVFLSGNVLRGFITVTADNSSFQVPFFVGVP